MVHKQCMRCCVSQFFFIQTNDGWRRYVCLFQNLSSLFICARTALTHLPQNTRENSHTTWKKERKKKNNTQQHTISTTHMHYVHSVSLLDDDRQLHRTAFLSFFLSVVFKRPKTKWKIYVYKKRRKHTTAKIGYSFFSLLLCRFLSSIFISFSWDLTSNFSVGSFFCIFSVSPSRSFTSPFISKPLLLFELHKCFMVNFFLSNHKLSLTCSHLILLCVRSHSLQLLCRFFYVFARFRMRALQLLSGTNVYNMHVCVTYANTNA